MAEKRRFFHPLRVNCPNCGAENRYYEVSVTTDLTIKLEANCLECGCGYYSDLTAEEMKQAAAASEQNGAVTEVFDLASFRTTNRPC